MIKFSVVDYGLAFEMAAYTRDRIFGENSLVDVEYFFEEIDSSFEKRALKPHKWTHLHEFIEYSISEDITYAIRKGDPLDFVVKYMQPTLNARSIQHISSPSDYVKQPNDDDDDLDSLWIDHIHSIFEEKVLASLTNEVFTLMYADREALLKLNEIIAKTIKGLKFVDYPNLLKSDGKVIRCSYWPKWLHNALFCREKGHCSLCLSDLSGLFAAGKVLAIDHIVPLILGGTNDPTNLQILCEGCNSKKGGGPSQSSSLQHLYWSVT